MHRLAILRLGSRRIAKLLYEDVAVVDPRTKYVEAKRVVFSRAQAPNHSGDVRWGGIAPVLCIIRSDRTVDIDDGTAEVLENYLNAQPPGRPYVDFRPEASGPYLFPSPRRATALSHWSVNRILRAAKRDSKPHEKATHGGMAPVVDHQCAHRIEGSDPAPSP